MTRRNEVVLEELHNMLEHLYIKLVTYVPPVFEDMHSLAHKILHLKRLQWSLAALGSELPTDKQGREEFVGQTEEISRKTPQRESSFNAKSYKLDKDESTDTETGAQLGEIAAASFFHENGVEWTNCGAPLAALTGTDTDPNAWGQCLRRIKVPLSVVSKIGGNHCFAVIRRARLPLSPSAKVMKEVTFTVVSS